MTNNRETAQLLKRVAAVFRVLEGDTFRYKAYVNAAFAIEDLDESLEELWKRNDLDSIPGIGESLKGYLGEYIRTGKVRHFNAQLKKVPSGMFALMTIRGVGPITSFKIAKKFHLDDEKTAIAELKKILKAGKLTSIKSFKEKTVRKIQKALDTKVSGKGRFLISQALPVALSFIEYLKKSPVILDAEPLGSLRRKLATIGDIDLAVKTNSTEEAMNYTLNYPHIVAVVTKGDKVSHVKLDNDYEIDIKTSSPENWGSLLQHYTGSKLHNIKLRTITKAKGISLSEYGIKKGKKTHFLKTEKDFYGFLGMEYIPPEIREDKGEIEVAEKHEIPRLIEEKDIKGDLHIHSDYSYPSSHDIGISSLSEILAEAESLGYEYIGVSDHNPKSTGLSDQEKINILKKRNTYLKTQYEKYEKSVKKRAVKLLIGLEVDIRADGSLALPEKGMDLLDYAIVSIHGSFYLSEEENTKRIIQALSHPKALILGHPTARMIGEREPIRANWDEIFEFCAKHHKLVEINASPSRADLPDDMIAKAIEKGVTLIINTDSHDANQMKFMKYGVWQARRGWATKKNIANSKGTENLRLMLN